MHRKLGLRVLGLGLGVLGLWAAMITAPRIQDDIRSQADPIAANSVHQMTVTVSGRDIILHGMADDRRDLAAVRAALRQISGQRTVRSDAITMLPPALPYLFSITKEEDVIIEGYVPSQAVRDELALIFGDQANELVLASGAPDNWMELIKTGLSALNVLPRGKIRLEGAAMIATGDADNPEQAAETAAVLTDLAVPVINAVQVLDDGTPTKYGLNYQRIGGTSVRGKLPKGLSVERMQADLGVPKIKGDVKIARIGEVGDASYLTAWAGVLDQLESLTSSVDGADRKVLAKLIPGADAARVKAALETGGFVVRVTETPKPVSEGETRSNPQTGAAEIFQNGNWIAVEPVGAAPTVIEPLVPVSTEFKVTRIVAMDTIAVTPELTDGMMPRIEPSAAAQFDTVTCQSATDELLTQTRIVFLPNSDALDESGAALIADLAELILPCAAADLRAEIGGHTDVSGDAAQNLILSQQRADRVRALLIENSVAEGSVSAKGYGSAQPIAGNDTPEGRAQNRRTTVIWSQ